MEWEFEKEHQKQISYNWNWRLPNWILTCSRWPSPRKTKAEKWSTTLKSLLNDNIDCTKSWVGPPTSFPRSENWPQFQLITSKSHQVLNGFSYLDDPIGNDLLDIYFFLLLVERERERPFFNNCNTKIAASFGLSFGDDPQILIVFQQNGVLSLHKIILTLLRTFVISS